MMIRSGGGGDKPRSGPNEMPEVDLSGPVELVVLSTKQRAARCRTFGDDRIITLRAAMAWSLVPGYIVTVIPNKYWPYAGHPYLSGEIVHSILDVERLGLRPLRLEERGMWDPDEHWWGEEDEPLTQWAEEMVAAGARPEFEMERVGPW